MITIVGLVPCMTCGATLHEYCRSRGGAELKKVHIGRRRMAVRAENKRKEDDRG